MKHIVKSPNNRDTEEEYMAIRTSNYIGMFLLFLIFFATGRAAYALPSLEREGELVIHVTWGDNDNTPANDVYAEAHGWVWGDKDSSFKSFVLKMTHVGEYKTSLPPGVYDVFISEGGSVPTCKRVLVKKGLTTDWTLKLEMDHVYSEK
jgi:hypothetical protein